MDDIVASYIAQNINKSNANYVPDFDVIKKQGQQAREGGIRTSYLVMVVIFLIPKNHFGGGLVIFAVI